MLDALALPRPSPFEPAKAREGRDAALKSPKDSHSGATASHFAYAHEETEIRVQSRDGDVLEIRRSLTVAVGYSAASRFPSLRGDPAGGPGKAGNPEGVRRGEDGMANGIGTGPDGLPEPGEAMKWAREVAREMEKQQARLLESFLKEGQGAAKTGFALFAMVLTEDGAVARGGETERGDGLPGLPEYWNAENTSDRIVAFATGFAGIHGGPGFGEKIVEAVLEGFEQARGILGELPGAAGKLNRDTEDLVLAKLEKWLEGHEAGAYNQEAQKEILDSALAA